jgi:hypothetical protein
LRGGRWELYSWWWSFEFGGRGAGSPVAKGFVAERETAASDSSLVEGCAEELLVEDGRSDDRSVGTELFFQIMLRSSLLSAVQRARLVETKR